jgi:glucose/arabinose dehydrogenase
VRRIALTLLISGLAASLSYAAETVDLRDIKLPKGFRIESYADVPHARSLALGDKGVVFVSNRRATSVYAVLPQGDANPEVFEFIKGLKTPNGIAFSNGDLYIAEINRILRYRNIESSLNTSQAAEILDIRLPEEEYHGWRYLGFGPDGKLYISIGSPCNVCDRDAEGFGQIWRLNPDGTGRETYASGIRNSVGFTWHPQTGELWFTDNGRDMLGDDIPPDELNRVSRPGMHFGFPYCHGGEILDPEFGTGRRCEDYTPPMQKLGPHVAALGVRFYTGTMFPDEYRGQIFIAEHGSWNRSKKSGYRVSLVRLENGIPVSYEAFAEGWLKGDEVSGRPVDLLVMKDGSMLVSDDQAGKLYRIYYEE